METNSSVCRVEFLSPCLGDGFCPQLNQNPARHSGDIATKMELDDHARKNATIESSGGKVLRLVQIRVATPSLQKSRQFVNYNRGDRRMQIQVPKIRQSGENCLIVNVARI
jgi:hypothetical protein